jgi:zinc transporter 1
MRKARSPLPPPRSHIHTIPAPMVEVLERGRDCSPRSDHTLAPCLEVPQDEMSKTAPLICREDPEGRKGDSHGRSPRGKSPERVHSHGHSHGSMNMKAILLHVLRDALGNVGVIATGLIIWQTTWSYKYYFDPVISLLITIIIFSAMPLGESCSLQSI